MKSIDLSEVYQKYKGLWVALTQTHTVISADKSAKKTLEEAIKKGYPNPTLFVTAQVRWDLPKVVKPSKVQA